MKKYLSVFVAICLPLVILSAQAPAAKCHKPSRPQGEGPSEYCCEAPADTRRSCCQTKEGPHPEIMSQWCGARVAVIGDSVSDPRQTERHGDIPYWKVMEDILGIVPYVYAVNGHRMNQVLGQVERLTADHGNDFDAILIFMGTNDFNHSVPLGEWFTYEERQVECRGRIVESRKHREAVFTDDTFRGRINIDMAYLKSAFPDKQIIFLTPIHRGYARFGQDNIQPDESYANACGSFVDEYVEAIKEAGDIWSVPVIDLFSISTLYPNADSYLKYFRGDDSSLYDRLHPNSEGHKRLAYVLSYQLLGYPARFE